MAKKTKQQHQALTLRERCHLLHGNGEWKLHGCKRLGIEGIEIQPHVARIRPSPTPFIQMIRFESATGKVGLPTWLSPTETVRAKSQEIW